MEGVVKMPFSKQENSRCRSNVIIVGGGLAGLAAATALVDSGCAVTILEGRRHVGGRAASFEDPVVGGLVLVSASKLESLTFFGVIARFFLLDPMEVGLPVRRHDCCQLRCI